MSFRGLNPRILKQCFNKRTGYFKLALSTDGVAKTKVVHKLVLMTFGGPQPEGMEACHNDGDTSNNRSDNLRWDTHQNNMRDKIEHGTHQNTLKTHCPSEHRYSEKNTYIYPDGRRGCRECYRIRGAKMRAKKRAENNGK